MSMELEQLKRSIEMFRKSPEGKHASFTLEAGRGQTYSTSNPVLYGHGEYGRGSVLAGRSLRRFFETWETWEEARTALAEIGLEYDDFGSGGGSTHVPLQQVVAHLPDDTDY